MSIVRKEIAAIREEYIKGALNEGEMSGNAVQQFEKWFQEAIDAEVYEPTAMVLSTVDAQCKPSSRVVLLKDIQTGGFSFFTNYLSRKAREVSQNPQVALLFFWNELQRQVRVEGRIERLPEKDSDEYFSSRPRGSQIGAWASPQSEIIPNRGDLETRVAQISGQYRDRDIERPPHWGGYLVKPTRIEFWQGRASRLHDRVVYEWIDGQWNLYRLAP